LKATGALTKVPDRAQGQEDKAGVHRNHEGDRISTANRGWLPGHIDQRDPAGEGQEEQPVDDQRDDFDVGGVLVGQLQLRSQQLDLDGHEKQENRGWEQPPEDQKSDARIGAR